MSDFSAPSTYITNSSRLLFLASTILALVLFWAGLENIFSRWLAQPEYSHGFFIPLVSLYILWEKRALLTFSYTLPFALLGLLSCLIAIVLLVIGEVSALYITMHYGFLFFLLGLAFCFLGPNAKYAYTAIAILAFAIPLPYVIEVVLTAKMQLMSSTLGVDMIRRLGIPVYLSGNIIDMGAFKLHVVEACSGLRYLFPLSCIGFLMAYFYRAVFWKKAIIFLSTIPITIVLNSFRIAASGVIAEAYGIESARGFLHDFEGWVVFLLCMTVLIVEVVVLERMTTKMPLSQAFKGAVQRVKQNTDQIVAQRMQIPHIILPVLLCVSIFSIQQIDERHEANVNNISFASFPMQFGLWQGRRNQLDFTVLQELALTDYVIADFYHRDDMTSAVNFYVAFYQSQRKGVSPHSPKVCIPGGGWEIAEFKRTSLNDVPVNQALIRKGSESQLVYYWFVERGQAVANEYYKKWMLFRDALALNRTDGALVRLVVPIESAESRLVAEEKARSLMQVAYPKLLSYLPDSPSKKN